MLGLGVDAIICWLLVTNDHCGFNALVVVLDKKHVAVSLLKP